MMMWLVDVIRSMHKAFTYFFGPGKGRYYYYYYYCYRHHHHHWINP